MMDPNKGLQNYVSAQGRADAFLFRGMKVTPEFNAQLKFGLNEYQFTLKAADDRSLFFSHESAPFDGPRFGPIQNDKGSGHQESKLGQQTHGKSENFARNTIQNWRIYHFHDTTSSAPVMGLCNIVDSDVLHSNASNIAAGC